MKKKTHHKKEYLNLKRKSCGGALKQDHSTYDLAVRNVSCILNNTCRLITCMASAVQTC